jgi:pimeloyl-ACP methyl ester carboxylesterase
MPLFHRAGYAIHYDIVGDQGPWVVLTPGGRGAMADVQQLAKGLAAQGYRVVIHDRRNCGRSDVFVDGEASEQEVWVEDVYALLLQLQALPVIAGGGSAGCRLSLLLAIKYPDAVRGLLLWWVTGGAYAATALAHEYYGQFIDIATEQGMVGICESEFFAARIEDNPANRARLLAMDPIAFIRVMQGWRDYFLRGAALPVIGATAEQLQAIKVPTLIIPGSDDIHPRASAVRLNELMAGSQLQYPFERAELDAIRNLPQDALLQAFQQRLQDHCQAFLLHNFAAL